MDSGTATRVVVIGAGPAGLSAAKCLNHEDIDSVLLARESSPGESKACGGFVPTRCFEEFGFRDFAGCHPIKGVRMKLPGQGAYVVELDGIVGYNASRENLGIALREWAGQGSCNIRMDTDVGSVKRNHTGCTVTCHHGQEDYVLTCDMVIDASGASPVTSKAELVRPRLLDDRMGYAVQYQMVLPPSSGYQEHVNTFLYGSEYSPGGYAWVFPRSVEVVVGTGGFVSRTKEKPGELYAYLDHIMTTVEPFDRMFVGAQLAKREAALLPLAGVLRPSYTDRVLLAGDAAGHCSPITGEGIYYSMLGGREAGTIAAKAMRRNDFSAAVLAEYEARWVRAIASDLKWGLWLQKRFTKPGSGVSKSGFLSSEKSRRIVAEMLVGRKSVRQAILSVAPGYLRSRVAVP